MSPSKDFIKRWTHINPANINLAGDLTAEFLDQGIALIDGKMGKGYAKSHPSLIDSVINNMASNYSSIEHGSKLDANNLNLSHQADAMFEASRAISSMAFEIQQASIYEPIKEVAEKLGDLQSGLDLIAGR